MCPDSVERWSRVVEFSLVLPSRRQSQPVILLMGPFSVSSFLEERTVFGKHESQLLQMLRKCKRSCELGRLHREKHVYRQDQKRLDLISNWGLTEHLYPTVSNDSFLYAQVAFLIKFSSKELGKMCLHWLFFKVIPISGQQLYCSVAASKVPLWKDRNILAQHLISISQAGSFA